MTTLAVRFANKVSKMETTQQRVKDLAGLLGVSQNKAIHYAVNQAYEALFETPEQEAAADALREKEAVVVGGISYRGASPEFLRRVQSRIDAGTPLPHEDDETLESNLLFSMLEPYQQAQVKAQSDPLTKRELIAAFVKAAAAQ